MDFEIYCPVQGVTETIALPESYDFDDFEGAVACGFVCKDPTNIAFSSSSVRRLSARLRISIKQHKIIKVETIDEHID